jgi:hypothetical protein
VCFKLLVVKHLKHVEKVPLPPGNTTKWLGGICRVDLSRTRVSWHNTEHPYNCIRAPWALLGIIAHKCFEYSFRCNHVLRIIIDQRTSSLSDEITSQDNRTTPCPSISFRTVSRESSLFNCRPKGNLKNDAHSHLISSSIARDILPATSKYG